MTTLSPVPTYNPDAAPPPGPRRRRHLSGRAKVAVAGGVTVALVAGVLGAAYQTVPGGTLWGVEKTVFPAHAQEVALTAVAADLKRAQDILGGGQQPTADQLSDARTALNQAKQNLDYLSASPEQASLQNLYLQLTQQLLEYTPASAQQLPELPAPPPVAVVDPALGDPAAVPDAMLMSSTAPSWGYSDPGPGADVATISQQSGEYDYGPPPPGVPAFADPGWQQPYAPPLTPNLQNLGYYDPSWGQLYGYNQGGWYNYDLGGYNQYGYDFLGFNRWGYDRWGYDRWGYDRWGYNWGGYNWAGYDRGGWDRDGRNLWGQRRGWPGDPRNQGWYDSHHAFQAYYDWKFRQHDPVFHRTQWDKAHGFNRDRYQDWNKNRDWHNPRNRDWAPVRVGHLGGHASAPVVNLNVALTQFISNDKSSHRSETLLKDLKGKSPRDFSKGLVTHHEPPLDSRPGDQPRGTSPVNHQAPQAPPVLTDRAPKAPRSKVAPDFKAPEVAPVPVVKPAVPARSPWDQSPRDKARQDKVPFADAPNGKTPFGDAPRDNAPFADSPKDKVPFGDMPKDKEKPGAGQPDQGKPNQNEPRSETKSAGGQKDSGPGGDRPAAPKPDRPVTPPRDGSGPRGDGKVPQSGAQSDAPAKQERPQRQESPQQAPERPAPKQSAAPERPAPQRQPEPEKQAPQPQQHAPEPKRQAPAPEPKAPAPVGQAPVHQDPPRQAPAPKQQAPAPQREAPAPKQQAPVRQAPAPKPQRQAPPQHHEAPKQAPQHHDAPRQAPQHSVPKGGGGGRCSGPFCPR